MTSIVLLGVRFERSVAALAVLGVYSPVEVAAVALVVLTADSTTVASVLSFASSHFVAGVYFCSV